MSISEYDIHNAICGIAADVHFLQLEKTMNSFDPKKLNPQRQGNDRQFNNERLFVVVENFEIPNDGYHYAVGYKANSPAEKVKVRLNTVEERAKDFPKADVEKIKEQYFSGQKHRDSLADKAKDGIIHLSFDDARKIEGASGGVAEYRAHWPKTMSTRPESEVISGIGTILLREQGSNNKASALVNFIKDVTEINEDNIDAVLAKGLSIKDDIGRAKNPYISFKAYYEDDLVAMTNLYPATKNTPVFDQNTGAYKDVRTKVDAKETLDRLFGTEKTGDIALDGYLDRAKALIAGIKGFEEPKYFSTDANLIETARQYYFGTKEGKLKVVAVENESIYFGSESRKTYLNDKARPHLNAYNAADENDDTKTFQGYTDTVIAVDRYPDGEPYAVFAAPASMNPKMLRFSQVSQADLHPSNAMEKSQVAVREHSSPSGADAVAHEEMDEESELRV